MKVFEFMSKRSYIESVVDNRGDADAPSITVTLKEGYFFKDTLEATYQVFASLRAACAGSSKNNVFNPEEDAKKAEMKAGKAKAKAPKVEKVPKAKAPKVEKVVKATKTLSMTPDAIAKRAKRAAQKVAAAAIVADALVS